MNHLRSMRTQRGVTLVELMISLVLGLLVVAGAVGIFASNRRAYASTETLGRLQETGRVAFELMARDIREAGATPCGKNILIANTLNNSSTNWYTDFATGMRGYEGGANAVPVAGAAAGTDAIDILSATSSDVYLTSYNKVSSELNVSSTAGISDGDVAIICDYKQGAIFQITQVQSAALKLQHNPGGSVSPGNCTKMFNYPVQCKPPANPKNPKVFTNGAAIAHLSATRWYVADAPAGAGKTLYRSSLRTAGGNATMVAEQVAEGVEDMEITYLQSDKTAYVEAGSVTNWGEVVAVRLTVTLQARAGSERGKNIQGTDNAALTREITHTVTLRNRLS